MYLMTFFAFGVSTDLRYAYWAILAGSAGAVASRAETQASAIHEMVATTNSGMKRIETHPVHLPLRAVMIAAGIGSSIMFVPSAFVSAPTVR